jgi:hypothetical protein
MSTTDLTVRSKEAQLPNTQKICRKYCWLWFPHRLLFFLGILGSELRALACLQALHHLNHASNPSPLPFYFSDKGLYIVQELASNRILPISCLQA